MSLVFSWTVDTVSLLSGTEVGREGSCSWAAACTHSTGAHRLVICGAVANKGHL